MHRDPLQCCWALKLRGCRVESTQSGELAPAPHAQPARQAAVRQWGAGSRRPGLAAGFYQGPDQFLSVCGLV